MTFSFNKFEDTGSWSRDGNSYTERYKVACSDKLSSGEVLSAGRTLSALPQPYAPYLWDATAYVTTVGLDKGEDDYNWVATASYGPLPAGQTATTNPLQEKPVITWGFSDYDLVADKDNSGALVKNSAGDPFDPPLTETFSFLTLSITRNVTAVGYNPLTARDYKNSVNSADCTVAGITITNGDGLLKDYSMEPKTTNGVSFIQEKIGILISDREGRWARKILDAGLYEMVNGKRTRIQDDNGQDVVSPVKLNGAGAKAANGAAPTWLTWNLKKQRSWAGLNLPAAMF